MHSLLYLQSMAEVSGVPHISLQSAGTTVIPIDSRRGKRLISQYLVGDHCLLFIDPDLALQTKPLVSTESTLSQDYFASWAVEQGAEHLGFGREFVLGTLPMSSPTPNLVRLDGTKQSTKDLVGKLHQNCHPDDVEQAEFEVEDLDPTLVGWLVHGALIALAGARPWEARPGLRDIGVLVHPEHRRKRAGTKVVQRVVHDLMDDGETPLYRCDNANLGSVAIAQNAGFHQAAILQVVALPNSGSGDG